MNPLENLFKFPILMIDGAMEEKKSVLALNDSEVDLIQGVAECPFQDFVSITDRWLPTTESFERAKDGKFDACYAVFSHSGNFIIPWTRNEFKKRFSEFVNKLEDKMEDMPSITVSKEQMKKILEADGE